MSTTTAEVPDPGRCVNFMCCQWGCTSSRLPRLANKYYGVTLAVDGKVGPKTWPVLRAHAL
ncbi:hypothetical protein O1M63_55200 [Streptomyces mirabilis]|nr:hypothetical protein [Streptomyces mirabilis]